MMNYKYSNNSIETHRSNTLRTQAIEQLRNALWEQPKFIKLHAAESLLELGYGEDVLSVFEKELKQFGGQPEHRVGIWRVLARAATTELVRLSYVNLLCEAFLNPESPDPVHAVESLSKLQYRINMHQRPKFEQAAKRISPWDFPIALWLLAISGTEHDLVKLAELLDADHPLARGNTAYSLRFLRDLLTPTIIGRIAAVADEEPEGLGRTYLLSAAYVTSNDPQQTIRFKELLLPYTEIGSKDQKYEVASALALRGDKDDFPTLVKLLNDQEPDVRVAAANAILKIGFG